MLKDSKVRWKLQSIYISQLFYVEMLDRQLYPVM